MPEKEAELSALENVEAMVPEEGAEDAAAGESQAEEPTVGGAEFGQLQAENDELKKERDQLKDRAGAAPGGV